MRIFVSDCGGVLGPPLVRWLLAHDKHSLTGSDLRHEPLGELLREPRFSFYVRAGEEDPALVRELRDGLDVVVSLGAVEHPPDAPGGALRARARGGLVRTCVDIGARLVYVTPVVAVPGATEPDAAEAETQGMITAAGARGELDYVIAHPSHTVDARLRALPAGVAPALGALRDALRRRAAAAIALAPADYESRTFTYADDVADCLGRIVVADSGEVWNRTLEIAHPANTASTAALAQALLERYQERRWNRVDPLPRLVEPAAPPAVGPPTADAPNIDETRRLTGWEPRWPLPEVIDLVLDTLVAER